MLPTFTIGIEEEYQTVDPVTFDLRSHIHAEIIEKGKLILQEKVKSEMHASVVEVGTAVCNNIKDAKEEVKKLRRDHVATQLLDFFFRIFDVVANCGTDLDHGGVHLRLNFLLKDQLALLNNLSVDMRAQIECDGIDCLIFLFNSDSEGGKHGYC